MNELDEKFACLAQVLGEHVGDVIRCMVETEIASHVARIQQLSAVLAGACVPPVTEESAGDTADTSPPTLV